LPRLGRLAIGRILVGPVFGFDAAEAMIPDVAERWEEPSRTRTQFGLQQTAPLTFS
jgi:hypothetical protein